MEIDIEKQVDLNIKYKNNSVFDLSINVTKSGVAYDMSGKTIRAMVKSNRNFQSYLYLLSSGTEITISTANLTFNKVMNIQQDTVYIDIYNESDGDYIGGGLIKVKRNITT